MKELNTTSRIFSYLSVLTGSLWLGAYLTRLFISYQIFEGPDLNFKAFVNPANLNGILQMLLPAVTTTFVLFIAFIVFYVLFLITSRLNFRENGWLFIMSIIILICVPFEIYLMTIDYPMILQLNSGNYASQIIVDMLIKRFKVLGSFPLIEIFCFMSLYYFILFRPFTKKIVINNEN